MQALESQDTKLKKVLYDLEDMLQIEPSGDYMA